MSNTDTDTRIDTNQNRRDPTTSETPPLTIECPRCGSPVGEPCVWAATETDPAISHFAREAADMSARSTRPRIVTSSMRPRISDLEPGVTILRTARVRNAWVTTIMPCHQEIIVIANQARSGDAGEQAVCRRCHLLYDVDIVPVDDADPQVSFTVTGLKVTVSRPRVPELGE